MQSSPSSLEENQDIVEVAEEDVLRANFYGLLSSLLFSPPSADLLKVVQTLTGDESPFGQALTALGASANEHDHGAVEEEFTRLFYGHGAGGEIHPYASFYLTGFVYDKPLSALREDLVTLGLMKSGVSCEPEDHIAFLMNVMHELIMGEHGSAVSVIDQKDFFEKHLEPWASKFFEDLEKAENSEFFRSVGIIGQLLMQIENEAFSMTA